MRLRRAASLTLAALALLPAAATADPPWSAETTVSQAHTLAFNPGIAVAGDGVAVAAWGWQDGTSIATASTGSAVAFRNADGTWSAERAVKGWVSGPPVTYRTHRYTVPTNTFDPPDGARTTLAVVNGRTGAAPGPPRRIFTGLNITRSQLAGNSAGAMALVWMQRRGETRDRVYVSVRNSGDPFGKPQVLAQERVRNVAVAVSERGDVLVAWDARGVVRTRIKLNVRPGFSRAQTIRSAPAFTHDLRAAMHGSGRAYVAWTAQLQTEGGTSAPGYVQVAVRPAGKRFQRAHLLERLGPDRTLRGLGLALEPASRDANVAWVGHDGTTYRVRHARVTGTTAAPQDLPDGAGEYTVEDLAGHTLMLTRFTDGGDTPMQVLAAQDFGAPETVTPVGEVSTVRAALLPDGRAAAVWAARSGDRATVQSATRG